MRIGWWLAAALLCTTSATVRAADVAIDMKGAGICDATDVRERADPASPEGKRVTGIGTVVTTRTNRIPAKLGTIFCVIFSFRGPERGTPVEYRTVIRHPPLQRPGSRDAFTLEKATRTCLVGRECALGYKLGYDWMLVPGQWSFEIRLGKTVVHRETFDVVAP